MADFCKDCSIRIFGEDMGDLKDLCKSGEFVWVLCEGCGTPSQFFILVDHTGQRRKDLENQFE